MEKTRTIGRYRILREIGGGSMGRVYEAEDTLLGRKVALKVLPPGGEQDSSFLERFQREAKVAAALNHPNLVAVYDAGEDPDTGGPFLVMELIDGQSLKQLLERRGACRPRMAARLVRQAARGLHHAHGKGIVHRDVKPGNLLLSRNGVLKVADFGIARPDMSEMTRTGQLMGTPHYMAPEQVAGEAVDARTDVFALGVVLYQLLTGEKPFSGDSLTAVSYRVVHSEPAPVSAIRPSVPPAFDEILARSLAKSPSERYPDASAMAQDLEALESALAADTTSGGAKRPLTSSSTAASHATGPGRAWSRWAITSGIGAIALACALFLVLRDEGPAPSGPDDSTPSAAEASAAQQSSGSQGVSGGSPPLGGDASSAQPGPSRAAGATPAPSRTPGDCVGRLLFRHSQESGYLAVDIDGQEAFRQSLEAGGSFRNKEEVRWQFSLAPGEHEIHVRLGLVLEDGSPEQLEEGIQVSCADESSYPLLVKYHRFLKARNLTLEWDTPRARNALDM